jgi:hypothetical protein
LSGALFGGTKSAFGQASVKYMAEDISNALGLQQLAVVASRNKDFDASVVYFVIEAFSVRRKSVVDALQVTFSALLTEQLQL